MAQHKCTRWAVDLASWSPTLPQLAQAVAVIQAEERDRLQKFFYIDDFLSSLVGRLLMRKYVSVQSGMDYKEVQFARDVRGKPYWTQAGNECPNQMSFNVSHQGNFVLFAGVSMDTKLKVGEPTFGVGVDVMKIEYSGGKSLSEFFRIMQRKFSDSEWRYIRRPHHNEFDQVQAFMRHWCLKEAYVKELGVGITIDLQKISFKVDSSRELSVAESPLTGTTLRCNDMLMHDWHFEEHLLHPKYCAAIAFRNCKPEEGKFELLKMDELLVETESATSIDVVQYCRKALRKERRKS
ncbi:L-aminoadipate-semialdehyde dehydrogenase-phosphopantetheinyl transferase-like [Rhagoletis pomonella]|uniref:L-aminoadipate-semialdehyde dehydrogenase-phosphopantetheinyl transferase-like n=1 Tax=Rhagoletis pomonella TaxID=28610 RepID=UPI0017841637|nr:L-aminoadipate-semialdehyde dehydrogenase-phosphopantetheinyl transferase-like [Rhagoletis pomonella]